MKKYIIRDREAGNKICLFAKSRTSFTSANSDYLGNLKAYITLLFFGASHFCGALFLCPKNAPILHETCTIISF